MCLYQNTTWKYALIKNYCGYNVTFDKQTYQSICIEYKSTDSKYNFVNIWMWFDIYETNIKNRDSKY